MTQNPSLNRWLLMNVLVVASVLGFADLRAEGQVKNTEHTLKLAENQKGIEVDVRSLDWLVGRWVGEGLGGECEETFLPIWNGELTGTFRMAQKGKLIFSEFFALVQEEGVSKLKLRHFNPDMTSWEEKDKATTFPLIKLEEKAAYFGGLTYKLESPDSLSVWVAMKNSADSELTEAVFHFKRVREPEVPK